MAAGYAQRRLPVHPHIIAAIEQRTGRVGRALDVGCGSGLSTAALSPMADERIGIEPSKAMLRWSHTVAPGAYFVTGTAEELPLRTHSCDLVTAAGSLNYVDLSRFFPEAYRVLQNEGLLAVYDFSGGRTCRETPALHRWYEEFLARFPPPACRELDPESLHADRYGFQTWHSERFEVTLPVTFDHYTEYVLTETNVEAALEAGAGENEIRDWCRKTLTPVFSGGDRHVVFSCYLALLRRRSVP